MTQGKKRTTLVLRILSTLLLIFSIYNKYYFCFYMSQSSSAITSISFFSMCVLVIFMLVDTWNNKLWLRRTAYIISACLGMIWLVWDYKLLCLYMQPEYTLLVLGSFTDVLVGLLLLFSAKRFRIGWGIGIAICIYLEWLSSYSCLLIQIPFILACAFVNINGTIIRNYEVKEETVEEKQKTEQEETVEEVQN